MIEIKKIQNISLIFFAYLVTRLITYFYFEISIEEKWISILWQHINIVYLKNNLIESLIFFHAQPPIWNLILGLGVKIDNILNIEIYLKILNHFFSLLIIYSSHQIIKNLNLKKIDYFFIMVSIIICSPSILFYENFPSYAHFTCALIFLIKLTFLKIYKKYKFKYELLIYIFSTLLILTWSAYIIYYNIFIFLLLFPLIIKKKLILRSSIIFFVFFMIGISPSLKNKILFDIFANSSWTGLNAAQATGYDRENWPLCSFKKYKLKEYNDNYKISLKNKKILNMEILNDKSYNDLGYIFKSKICSNKSKKFLILNFFEISKQKFKRFISVHAHLSVDFAFKPKNWKEKFYILENLNNNLFFKIIVIIFFLINYLFYILFFKYSLMKKEKNYLDYFIIINFLMYLYLLIVTFYGSTWEHERMRYSEYSFILISIILIIKKFRSLKVNL